MRLDDIWEQWPYKQTLFDHINETQLEDPKIMELIQHRDEENETNAFDTEIY